MRTILYTDDEPALLELGKFFLEKLGDFTVDTATSASDALSMMAAKNYDAIISDYQMPGMDGIAFLKRVRGSGSSIPFIIFTGKGREQIVIEALNEGVDSYLQKGGEPGPQFAELSHKVSQAIGKREAEQNLRNLKWREDDIIRFLPDATFAIDDKGRVIAWNRAMEDLTGVPAGEILGKGNYEYAMPIYHERIPILVDLVNRDGSSVPDRYPYLRREGRRLQSENELFHAGGDTKGWFWFIASPLYNDRNEVVGAIESIRDITDQVKAREEIRAKNEELQASFEQLTAAEEELRQYLDELTRSSEELTRSQEAYRRIIDTAQEGIWVMDGNSRSIFLNQWMADMLGYALEEMKGRPIADFIDPCETSAQRGEFSHRMEGKSSRYERRLRKKDGSLVWTQVSATPIISPDGSSRVRSGW